MTDVNKMQANIAFRCGDMCAVHENCIEAALLDSFFSGEKYSLMVPKFSQILYYT